MIMGQNQPYKLVDQLVANEFYNLEGRQFSKSDGWTIDIENFLDHFEPDQIRYALTANAPETADSEFTWKDFQTRCNSELLGKLGNLVNRVLVFTQNHCTGHIPLQGAYDVQDQRFLERQRALVEEARQSYSSFHFRRASQIVMELAQLGNAYFDAKKPWKAAKELELRGMMETTIACCLECIKLLALIAFPIIPTTAEKIWSLLGFGNNLSQFLWQEVLDTPLKPGTLLPVPFTLFRKIEDQEIAQHSEKLQKNQPEPEKKSVAQAPSTKPFAQAKEIVSFEEWQKIDLRVGQVIRAEKVAKSKKLLQLEVDLGSEKRTILSGISAYYSPEALIGKKVLIVANLAPAQVMGIESQGMLLVAETQGGLEVIQFQEAAPGAPIS